VRGYPLACRWFGHDGRDAGAIFEVPIEGHPSVWFEPKQCRRCGATYAVEIPAPPKSLSGPSAKQLAANLRRLGAAASGAAPPGRHEDA